MSNISFEGLNWGPFAVFLVNNMANVCYMFLKYPHLQNNHLLGVQDSLAITVAITFTSVTKQVVQLLVEHILVNYNFLRDFLWQEKGLKVSYI